MFVSGDNPCKGAALNSVQIAELLPAWAPTRRKRQCTNVGARFKGEQRTKLTSLYPKNFGASFFLKNGPEGFCSSCVEPDGQAPFAEELTI